ncbi:hypothetical protein CAPTEDRAFT_225300 [Capitella teleta]|uniref:Uncharacterized protein n=1 Tax=Capitella teleta TaxID=283909 RepID=R7U522_CAPTE|nr:hypothetical protein CAPTEDRAFT_225300 [Capitella teleta]|eukprot:ELU01226.1 hypothetical protein CAPTEDRAFT_225300 [Capitella teleta]
MTDAASRFDCCGVVSAWEFQSDFDDDSIDLQVWENVDAANKQATMKAFNTEKVDGLGIQRFDIAEADRIPVRSGDTIGWRAVDADLVKYLLNCGTCTLDYMQEDLSGGVPGTYGAGLQHTFTQDGNDVAETRDFFFRAEVTQAPSLKPGVPHIPAAKPHGAWRSELSSLPKLNFND